ncbi:hypothetical protein [Paraburkholderia phenoliruptrix]|uniref:hypothetical protein n=1 Tax=Paraburkholderia phenoliruptrix TaxID=252970 RepID=UPI0028653042|nr:hypothetical protein [Paraburkholderia phenoliruptrix]MDR6389190.1 hypothetical protein [Paraburkholderia phenoliruptrix]
MRIALADDPAVISIAARLSVDEFTVVGMLHHLWGWADTQSRDGHAPGVTNVWIDRYVRHVGFAEAMVSVGWLEIDESGVTFPNFDRHNGESAKARGLAAERKRNQRSRVTEDDGQMSRSERDKSVTREEKRREEDKESTPNASRPKSRKTAMPEDFSVSDRVESWAVENGYEFLDEHLASFRRKVAANGYKYVDWDSAFMEAIRGDWAKINGRPKGNTPGLVL